MMSVYNVVRGYCPSCGYAHGYHRPDCEKVKVQNRHRTRPSNGEDTRRLLRTPRRP